jgi:hypothetical protein
MNYKRDCFDKQFEEVIRRNEYILNPNEEPFKPSYLEYNRKNMRPILPQWLSGEERIAAERLNEYRKKITCVSEARCLEILRKVFPDIYKIQTTYKDVDPIDFHVPSVNFYIEHKERGGEEGRCFFEEDGGMTIDRKKYDSLMKEDHPYFLNSTNIGLFVWNLRLIGELKWRTSEYSPLTNSGPRKGEFETNDLAYLPYSKCNDLTYLLLQ